MGISRSQVDRRYFRTLMPQFATDLLSGLLINLALRRIQLHGTEATRCRCLPPRQHLINTVRSRRLWPMT